MPGRPYEIFPIDTSLPDTLKKLEHSPEPLGEEGNFFDDSKTLKQAESIGPPITDDVIFEAKPILERVDLRTNRIFGVLENSELTAAHTTPLAIDKGISPQKIKRSPTLKQRLLAVGATLGINVGTGIGVDSGFQSILLQDARTAFATATETDAERLALEQKAQELLKKSGKDLEKQEKKEKEQIVEERLELFLQLLRQRGGVPEEDISATRDFFHQIQAEFVKRVKENPNEDPLEVIYDLTKRFGRYNGDYARISDVATKQLFNCELFDQSILLTVPLIFPNMPIKLQWFGADENHNAHTATLIKHHQDWYQITHKNGPMQITLQSVKGTVITGPEAFERSLVERVRDERNPNKKTKSDPTNSVFSIGFPNAKVFEGGTDNAETEQEYQARMRSKYVRGKVSDPENPPPLTLYFGETLEDVASQMHGQDVPQDPEASLRPEDPHTLPETKQMKAIMEGYLSFYKDEPFYNLDTIDGVPINDIGYSMRDNDVLNTKYLEMIRLKFLNVKDLGLYNLRNSKEGEIVKEFSSLEKVRLAGKVNDISFLRGHNKLADLYLGTDEVVDLSPLVDKPLEKIALDGISDNPVGGVTHVESLNFENLREVDIISRFDSPEMQKKIASAPVLEKIYWRAERFDEVPFFVVDHFVSKSIKEVTILGKYIEQPRRPIKMDFQKFQGLPLEKFSSSGYIGDIRHLQGAPLKEVSVVYDGTPFSFFASSFPDLTDLSLEIFDHKSEDFQYLSQLRKLRVFSWDEGKLSTVPQFSRTDLLKMKGLQLEIANFSFKSVIDFSPQDVANTIMNKKDSRFSLNNKTYAVYNGVLFETHYDDKLNDTIYKKIEEL